jgi:hypothetical protein
MPRHPIIKVVNKLRDKFPPAYPVKIVFNKNINSSCLGLCTLVKQGRKSIFRISLTDYINNYPDEYQDLASSVMLESLIHEWAHALNWSHLHDNNEEHPIHDETWGVWYAKLYNYIFYEIKDPWV